MRRLQGQLGQRLDLESARALGIDRNVLQLLINRALFDQKAADLGMVVSDDVIKARILQEPAPVVPGSSPRAAATSPRRTRARGWFGAIDRTRL